MKLKIDLNGGLPSIENKNGSLVIRNELVTIPLTRELELVLKLTSSFGFIFKWYLKNIDKDKYFKKLEILNLVVKKKHIIVGSYYEPTEHLINIFGDKKKDFPAFNLLSKYICLQDIIYKIGTGESPLEGKIENKGENYSELGLESLNYGWNCILGENVSTIKTVDKTKGFEPGSEFEDPQFFAVGIDNFWSVPDIIIPDFYVDGEPNSSAIILLQAGRSEEYLSNLINVYDKSGKYRNIIFFIDSKDNYIRIQKVSKNYNINILVFENIEPIR